MCTLFYKILFCFFVFCFFQYCCGASTFWEFVYKLCQPSSIPSGRSGPVYRQLRPSHCIRQLVLPPDLQGHMRVFCICLSFDGRELPTVGITRFYARLTAAASQQTSCGLFSVPESTLPRGGMSAFHRNISKGQHYLLWLTEKKNGGGDILTLQNSRWSLSCSACKSPRDGSIGLLVLSFSTSTQTMRAQQQVGCFPVDAMWCSDTGILHLNWVFKE